MYEDKSIEELTALEAFNVIKQYYQDFFNSKMDDSILFQKIEAGLNESISLKEVIKVLREDYEKLEAEYNKLKDDIRGIVKND